MSGKDCKTGLPRGWRPRQGKYVLSSVKKTGKGVQRAPLVVGESLWASPQSQLDADNEIVRELTPL